MPKKDKLHSMRLDTKRVAIIEKILKKYADEGVEISTSEAMRVALRFWEKGMKKKP